MHPTDNTDVFFGNRRKGWRRVNRCKAVFANDVDDLFRRLVAAQFPGGQSPLNF